ncbi:uncharacterized protein LOC142175825 [Nicotiana tabacum]|uniref:Uncharacterized protein LOC142175825 n=1 Tax=Nicotiana tabacum TaxID=4097 RepID=A0AC58TNX3_TOBAC
MRIDETNGVSKFDTIDTLALESVNSGEPIDVFELERDLIILKTNQREIMDGQVYKDKATLNVVMEHYAIAERFQFRIDRSNVISYTLLCISKDYEWRFKASNINKSQMFKVKEFNDKHACPLNDKLMLAWRVKEKAMNLFRGEPADSYNKLPGYFYTLDMTYPGLHIRMGFDHCRPIVVVDGSHLKSAYTRTFVSASTLDGSAYGVIDSENDVAWSWFFEQFKEAYGERKNMCIVSDSNESIIKSVSRVYHTVHLAYIWHL